MPFTIIRWRNLCVSLPLWMIAHNWHIWSEIVNISIKLRTVAITLFSNLGYKTKSAMHTRFKFRENFFGCKIWLMSKNISRYDRFGFLIHLIYRAIVCLRGIGGLCASKKLKGSQNSNLHRKVFCKRVSHFKLTICPELLRSV